MVAKGGTSKVGGTISQQAVVHPWLAANVHGNKQTNKQTSLSKGVQQHTRRNTAKRLVHGYPTFSWERAGSWAMSKIQSKWYT
jgi:hypothetical protein